MIKTKYLLRRWIGFDNNFNILIQWSIHVGKKPAYPERKFQVNVLTLLLPILKVLFRDGFLYSNKGDSMHQCYLEEAVNITLENIKKGGRPFGAIIVKDGEIIARAVNSMLQDCDPTAHAEMSALRQAGKFLQSVDLSGCIVYASGEPCPMCQAAMYMAGVRRAYFVYSNDDGAPYQLSTKLIAKEMRKLPNERIGFTFKGLDEIEKAGYVDLYAYWDAKQDASSS